MAKYLNTKPGSVEEIVSNMSKNIRQDSAYQDMFKKELEKAGKGIGAMSPKEKKDFFNKIDAMYKAPNEKPEQKEELNKDDKKVVTKVKDMLKKASQAHAGQAKELDKALKEKDSYGNEINKAKHAAYKDPKSGERKPVHTHEGARLVYETIKGLKNKAEKSGMPYSILKKVYDRGMAAWRGGHRPGTTQQQWAFARVNSFVTKSSGTWGGADKDLAKQVRGSKK